MQHFSDNIVGSPIPNSRHAISVSLPTWEDTRRYKDGEHDIITRMKSGYPRFFVNLSIRKLQTILEKEIAAPSERVMLLCSSFAATSCVAFMHVRGVCARALPINPLRGHPGLEVYAVLFPSNLALSATQFWQNTGLGISSRVAEYCLDILDDSSGVSPISQLRASLLKCGSPSEGSAVSVAKTTLTERIATLLSDGIALSRLAIEKNKQSHRVLPENIFLYPMGMTAIWAAHQLCMNTFGQLKSVCFGFPYTDTLKVLNNWGPGCLLYAKGDSTSIDELETYLLSFHLQPAQERPLLALFTEFPSNPLLRAPDLIRLRKLADDHNFLIVVDETIGNFANVCVLHFADIVVTSLTKLFSGKADVAGGCLVLSPFSKHLDALRSHLNSTYEDFYYDEDAATMERNSRDFTRRSAIIDRNAEAILAYIISSTTVVSQIFYPSLQTKATYDICRIESASGGTGYGGLVSLIFASSTAARAFFDTLPFAKGPSLGTDFTLACPYALFAHYEELEWAEKNGVSPNIVRISIGMENRDTLIEGFRAALKAANTAHEKTLGKEVTWQGDV